MLRKYFGVIMAMLVLIASTGVGYVEHHCQLKGKHTQWIFAEPTHCHHDESQATKQPTGAPTIQKSDCCQDVVSFKNVETSATFGVKHFKIDAFSASSSLVHSFYLSPIARLTSPNYNLQPLSFSSRLHGRTMLSFVQSFLI